MSLIPNALKLNLILLFDDIIVLLIKYKSSLFSFSLKSPVENGREK